LEAGDENKRETGPVLWLVPVGLGRAKWKDEGKYYMFTYENETVKTC
jgi:hypothetical protein